MKLVKIYENLILEKDAQACVTQFGKELFADQLGGKEPNTSKEDRYVDLVSDFTDNQYGEEMNPEFLAAMNNLKGCMTKYPEVLKPETSKIYRGTTISADYFIKNKILISKVNPFKYEYKASSVLQSWSKEEGKASFFGGHDVINEVGKKFISGGYDKSKELIKQFIEQEVIGKRVTMGFVLEYKTNSKEFLFKSKYFNELSSAGQEEAEILRIDNKPCITIAKFNLSENHYISLNGVQLIAAINHYIKGKL